jgi:hypothetical protein
MTRLIATAAHTTMNRATKVLICTSVAVVGWHVLRYFHGRLLAPAGLAVEQSSVRDRKAYRRAAERWENEGGATLAGRTSEAESRIVEL